MSDDHTPHTAPDDTPGPLSRWAARKAQVAAESTAEQTTPAEQVLTEPAPAADRPAAYQPAARATTPPSQVEPAATELTDADMPSLDSLDQHSDASSFFSPKVSAELRRQALRKLFHLPHFNVTDGLNDYDEDFTTFAALGDIVTADMRHIADMKRQRAEQNEAEQSAADTDTAAAAEAEPQHADVRARDDDNADDAELARAAPDDTAAAQHPPAGGQTQAADDLPPEQST